MTMDNNKTFTKEEVFSQTLEYFNGDELATSTFVNKYALKKSNGKDNEFLFLESTPNGMHDRLANGFERIEKKYKNPRSVNEIRDALDKFKYVVPGGSVMYGVNNPYVNVSLSNCIALAGPEDSMSGIINKSKDLANLFKARCVSEDTYVNSKDKGLIKIKKVKIGDKILSFDINSQKNVYKKVLNKYETNVPVSNRKIIKLKNGTRIKTSLTHPLLVFNNEGYQYKTPEYIDIDKDVLIKPYDNKLNDMFNFDTNLSDIGWWIGCHIGDGTCGINQNKLRIRIITDCHSTTAKYAAVCNSLTGSNAKEYLSSRKKYKIDCWEYCNVKKNIKDIVKLYLDNQTGKKVYTARIPQFIINNNLWLPFLAGLIDTDGTIKDPCTIVISLCNKYIIDQLSTYLATIGIDFYFAQRQDKRENCRDMYSLSIYYSKDLFNELIKYMSHDKKINKIKSYNKKYVDHRIYFITDKEKQTILSAYKNNIGKKVPGLLATQIYYLNNNKTNSIGRGAINVFHKYNLINSEVKNSILMRMFIKEICPDLESNVYYDLEVKDTNNFYAGNFGLVNIHNCGAGIPIDTLRPDGSPVNNSAETSTGAWSFANYYSEVSRMVGQCLYKDTLILTKSKGLVKIENVSIGDKVWSKKGWVNVIDKIKNNKNLMKITTKLGKEIICSKDHVFHTISGEKKVDNMEKGDPITQIVGEGWDGTNIKLNNCGNNFPDILNDKLAYILGYIYSNQNNEKYSIAITVNKNSTKLISYIKDVFGYEARVTKNKDYSVIKVNKRPIINYLNENNLLNNFQEQLLSATKEIVFSFLSGYFDANGYFSEHRKLYKFSSTDKQFLLVIQNILSAFGIISRLHNTVNKNTCINLYELIIKEDINKLLFVKYMKESIKVQATIEEVIGNISKKLDVIEETNNVILSQDFIKEVEDLRYVDDTYDLVLNEEHLFFANGLYAHNSGRRAALIITMSVKHPDIEKFIMMKRDLTKVTGANISIMLTDDFMEAVKEDKDWTLQWPVDVPLEEAKYTRTAKAKDIWFLINESAAKSAEPGLIFIDNYKNNLPADKYPDFKSVCVNPCCFDKNHNVWVLTNNGIKEIKEINKDDLIWVDEEKTWAKTSGYFDAGNSEVFKVSFSDGEKLYITDNHKLERFLTSEGNILTELKDLKVGDLINKSYNIMPKDKFGDLGTYKEGIVLGWLTSNRGTCYKNNNDLFSTVELEFFNNELDIYYKILNIVNKEDNIQLIDMNNEYNSIAKKIIYYNMSKRIVDKYNIDINSFKKGFNELLFKANKDFLVGYLSSYFSANGVINKNNIQLLSYDKERLYQIKNILSMFGIQSSIFYNNKLIISGKKDLVKFNREIRFLSTKKQSKLDNNINNNDEYELPIKYTKITNIESVGIKPVGCIEVEEYHKFTANGLISSNSEILLSENDSCRLTSINLKNFVINPFSEKAYFDYEKFEQIVRLSMRILDDIIDLEIESLTGIIDKVDDKSEKELWGKLRTAAENGRRTGLGTHGLADALACLQLKYDTKEAQEEADKIFSSLRNFAYDESVNLAIERGKFSCFDWNTEKDCDFITRLPKELQQKIEKYGRRNISILTNAPTGSVSIISQTSSGIEPVFMNFYTRRKKVSHENEKVDFVDDSGDKWTEYPVFHHNVMQFINENKDLKNKLDEIKLNSKASDWASEITKLLPDYFITAMDIDPFERVKMQGTIQASIDHGISSCLTEDSLIQTDKGLFQLSELVEDTPLKDFKDIKGQLKSVNSDGNYSEITQSYNNGLDDVLFIETHNGFNTKCTKNHRLLTLDSNNDKTWKYAYEIKKGDILIGRTGLNLFSNEEDDLENILGELPKSLRNSNIPKKMDSKLANLIGYLCYHTNIDENGQITTYEKSNDKFNEFIQKLNNLLGIEYEIEPKDDFYNIESQEIQDFVSWLQIGDKVPLVIRKATKENTIEFLKSLIVDSFEFGDNVLVMSYFAEQYIKQIQMLLLNLGIDSKIVCKKIEIMDSDKLKEYNMYNLYLSKSEYNKFADIIDLEYNIDPYTSTYYKSEEILSKEQLQEMISLEMNIPEFLLDKTYVFREVTDIYLLQEKQETFDLFVPEGNSYLSNGIINHNTINLPKETTVEQVQDIYESAWENKLKGVTVYVDGSRSGVLINQKDDNKIIPSVSQKRPKELPCEIHHSTIDGQKWTIFVGLLDGRPYEIFGGLSEYVTIPKKYKNGKIVKTKNGKKNVNGRWAFYNLVVDDGDEDPLEVQNIAVTFNNGNYAAQTRMISLALRHNVPVQYIVEQLGRDENSDFFSFSRVMARVLKKYIADGVESGDVCDECGAKLVFEAGCQICLSCGKSAKCN